jgi:membrane protein
MAAGVAFYGFLALFPAMIAAITAWSLFADPKTIQDQTQSLTEGLPRSAANLLEKQIDNLTTDSSSGALSFSLVITLALALWSASGGMGNLLTAINITYDEEDNRNFFKRKALALGLTLAAIVFFLLAIGLVAVAPVVFDAIGLPTAFRVLLEIGRWLLIIVLFSAALAVLYRVAPDREAPQFKWVSVGAVVATLLWVIVSLGFSLYVDNFANYNKTYGALAGVAVLMLWLWLTAFAVLLGGEINAESEEQTARDTTTGREKPIGDRGAVKADSLPPPEPT